MSYQVLARKWRPQSFAQMVGQEHVVKALCNALDNDRVHHALLFTGTRGVGKTSVARVLAKALNCERGVSSTPCGQCSACQEVESGRFVDLIEVDAASRTGVDDTRDLLDNVQYRPASGRYKVYLIDEVHMFSRNSFNALLKTLEEPPPHVKFLLATTDPRKLPATVLSRCLQFNLRRLSAGLIGRQLSFILGREGIDYEANTLSLLAHSADGSLRDALSLLDQAIAFCGGGLRTDAVREMLGTIDHGHVTGLLDCVVERKAVALLQLVETVDLLSPDYDHLLGELLVLLQRIAIFQVAGQSADDDVANPDALHRFAESMTPEDVQLVYQIGLIGRRDLLLSPDARSGFEMVLLRMLFFAPMADEAGQVTDGPADRADSEFTRVSAVDRSVAGGRSPAAPEAGASSTPQTAAYSRAGLARRALDEAMETESPVVPMSAGGDLVGEGAEEPTEVREGGSQETPLTVSALPREGDACVLPVAASQDADTVGKHVGDLQEGAENLAAVSGTASLGSEAIALEQWHRIFAQLDLDGVARELAANCILESCNGDRALLSLDSKHTHLCTPGAQNRLDEALGRHFSTTMRSEVRASSTVADTPADRAVRKLAARQRQAEQAIAEDPNVQTLVQTFGARILPRSVTPSSE